MISKTCAYAFAVILTASSAGPALAQQAPPDCEAEEHRQFDYWAGAWDVFNPDGEKIGENTITPILKGCALREQWRSTRDHAGTSINFYDRNENRWRQTWIANNGNPLYLAGGLEDGVMVMESVHDAPRQDRISWIPEDDGSVRQVWEISRDGGETWQVGFEGRYVRKDDG